MTDSRFTAANSFSLLTSSVSFVSLECISPPFPFIQSPTSFLKRLRLRCCRRQIRQIHRRRRLRLRRSLPHSSLRVPSPFPSAFQRCPQSSPAETRASRLRPIRLRAGHRRTVGQVLCQPPRGNLCCLAVVALPEEWHHRTTRITRPRIIDHRLEPVAHFNAILVLMGSDQQ